MSLRRQSTIAVPVFALALCLVAVAPFHCAAQDVIHVTKPIATLQGHTGHVWSVAFSPDGRRLATGAADGAIKLWDTKSWKENATLKGHKWVVRSVVFSPDGARLASASDDPERAAAMWNVATNEGTTLRKKGDAAFQAWSAAFSPDGKTLAVGAFTKYKLFDLKSHKEIKHVNLKEEQPNFVMSIAYSPDGKNLVLGLGDGSSGEIMLWNLVDGSQTTILKGADKCVYAIAFSPDGKTMATAHEDRRVELWDVATWDRKSTLTGFTGRVHGLAFSPDGKLASGGGRNDVGELRLWDVSLGAVVAEFSGHEKCVTDVSFSPNGKTLASGSLDGTVRIWQVPAIR